MHAIEVSIITAVIFLIITIIIDHVMYSSYGYMACDLPLYGQYAITFFTVFLFSLAVEYTELNNLVCSGNH